jgi:hypothetical protein
MLILFFDTYISSGQGDGGGAYRSTYVEQVLGSVRDKYPAYRWQKKIDVVRYTLSSYAEIPWDKIVIRFVCEDKEDEKSFEDYCRELFPSAKIERRRSATADEYSKALDALSLPDDSWVFFSPNNDHPYLAKPEKLLKCMDLADRVARENPKNDIGLLFSHFTESMLDNRPTDPQWGYFGFKFKKVVEENELAYITKSNIAPLDSIQVFKLGYLKKIFGKTKNKGRVIRLEDTEFCSSPYHAVIQICPKVELCRHYDGYTHLMDSVPPLFIPPGFFEKLIRIRYGYSTRKDGWVNINPSSHWLNSETDIPIILDDIPYFWRNRVVEVDINPEFKEPTEKMTLAYYKNFYNPWHKSSKVRNVIRSFYIYVFLLGWSKLRRVLRAAAIKLGIFPYLKTLKGRIQAKGHQ